LAKNRLAAVKFIFSRRRPPFGEKKPGSLPKFPGFFVFRYDCRFNYCTAGRSLMTNSIIPHENIVIENISRPPFFQKFQNRFGGSSFRDALLSATLPLVCPAVWLEKF